MCLKRRGDDPFSQPRVWSLYVLSRSSILSRWPEQYSFLYDALSVESAFSTPLLSTAMSTISRYAFSLLIVRPGKS